MLMGKPWVAFFSQTGSEIADLCEALGRVPDCIVTNKRPDHLRTIDSRIKNNVLFIHNRPTAMQLANVLQWFENPIVTLHGWLRIMPPIICGSYHIINGHPGLITKYPELKGKDPQVRAHELKHSEAGAVLHYVSAGVDEGEIIMSERFNAEGLELDDLFLILKDKSLSMWTKFLRDKI